MKFLKLDLSILTVILLFAATAVFGQQDEVKKEKKVVIITKTIDENGNEVTKKIVKEGADANVFILEQGEEDAAHLHKNVEVDMDDANGKKRVKIRIAKGDGADDVEVIEWSGEEEMPAEMLKELKEKGIHLDMHRANDFYFDSNDAPNNACLGVMIGMKKTVENINGEETTVTEGEPDQGVSILNIIENSGAAEAGLLKDDIITEINGTAVSSIEDVLSILAPFEAGATVNINYLRGKQAQQVTATLKACGDDRNREVEKEIEWTDEDGNTMNLNGNDWIFSGEDGEETNGQNRKIIIIKKNKDGEEITEEFDGDGINEFSPEGERTLDVQTIDIFPNPTDGKLTLSFTAPEASTTVKVVDVTGKEVFTEEIADFDGTYNKEIDLSKAAKGTMVLSILQGDKVFSEKIILQK